MTQSLSSLSEAIAALAAAAAPWLAAIRVGPNQHVTGTTWGDSLVVTTDRALPPRDDYTLVMPGGKRVAARMVHREPMLNLALLRLDQPISTPAMTAARPPAVGNLTIVVGADFDGSPTMRLTAVHRQPRASEHGAVLDMTEAQADAGSLALDTAGAVLGIVHLATDGAVAIVPHRVIARFIDSAPREAKPRPNHGHRADRRGWFGVALQPITVPEPLVPRAGQTSGRLVVGITAGSPADQAGLRVGDVLLSLDGHSTSGANSLRTFLEGSRIGSQVEARILRDTAIATAWLTIAEQP